VQLVFRLSGNTVCRTGGTPVGGMYEVESDCAPSSHRNLGSLTHETDTSHAHAVHNGPPPPYPLRGASLSARRPPPPSHGFHSAGSVMLARTSTDCARDTLSHWITASDWHIASGVTSDSITGVAGNFLAVKIHVEWVCSPDVPGLPLKFVLLLGGQWVRVSVREQPHRSLCQTQASVCIIWRRA